MQVRIQVLDLLKRGALSTFLHLSVFVTRKIWVMMEPISLGGCEEEYMGNAHRVQSPVPGAQGVPKMVIITMMTSVTL